MGISSVGHLIQGWWLNDILTKDEMRNISENVLICC